MDFDPEENWTEVAMSMQNNSGQQANNPTSTEDVQKALNQGRVL